jgi:hypothetical protein
MEYNITGYCTIHDQKVVLNDTLVYFSEHFTSLNDFLKTLYRREQVNYPKFYKMDRLSKLGFLTAELLFRNAHTNRYKETEVGLVLSNSSASLDTDMTHQETIKDRTKYFPSPSVFVYTLPNIVIGEICIRYGLKGENLFFVSEQFHSNILYNTILEMLEQKRINACVGGWVEILSNDYHSFLFLVEKKKNRNKEGSRVFSFQPSNIQSLFDKH